MNIYVLVWTLWYCSIFSVQIATKIYILCHIHLMPNKVFLNEPATLLPFVLRLHLKILKLVTSLQNFLSRLIFISLSANSRCQHIQNTENFPGFVKSNCYMSFTRLLLFSFKALRGLTHDLELPFIYTYFKILTIWSSCGS